MNAKERVRTALTRKGIPDRVPVQFDLCRSLTDAFGKKYGVPVDYSQSYYEDVTYRISANALRTKMGSDCVIVGGTLPAGYSYPRTPDGCIVNEFGMKMRQGPLYMEVIECPLANVSTESEIAKFPFPDPVAKGRFDKAKRDIENFGKDYFIIGETELSMFEMSWHMTGMEKFLADAAMGEPYIDALLDRVLEFTIGVGKSLVKLGVDGVWTGDDFGTQKGLMISPAMWRRMFKPRYARLFKELKSVNPNVLIMYHSDGAVSTLLPELIEIGLEVFNPVQPNVPGHDPKVLKSKFGNTLSFWGAIDQQDLLPRGTPADIERDVAEKIEILGAGGGYMCAPAHIVQADTSVENVEAFIAAVKKHGTYR